MTCLQGCRVRVIIMLRVQMLRAIVTGSVSMLHDGNFSYVTPSRDLVGERSNVHIFTSQNIFCIQEWSTDSFC